MSAGRGTGTDRGRRGDEHAHALGSVAVGTPADGMNIVPTRHADSAGASSSDSISRGVAWLGKRAGLGRRSHLELKRRLHLELNGVGILFVERRRQGDNEW